MQCKCDCIAQLSRYLCLAFHNCLDRVFSRILFSLSYSYTIHCLLNEFNSFSPDKDGKKNGWNVVILKLGKELT